MGLGKAVSVDDKPHHHLLAIGTFIPRISVLGLWIRQCLALKVRRGQVIQINRLIQVKEGPFPLAERRFNPLPLGCNRSRLRYSAVPVRVLNSTLRISSKAVRRIHSAMACSERGQTKRFRTMAQLSVRVF